MAILLPFILLHQILGAMCFPITKYGLERIEPFTFAFFRFVISSAVLLTIVRLRHGRFPFERSDFGRFVIMGILIIPFNQVGYIWGQSFTTAGHASLIFATTPIWVMILAAIYLRERITIWRTAGILLTVIGIVVIMGGGAIELGTQYLVGDLLVLGCVIAWGGYTVMGKPLVEKYGALPATAYSIAFGTVMYFPFGIWQAGHCDYSLAGPTHWLSVLYMAIGASVIMYVVWMWLLKQMEASRLAVFANIQPLIAVVAAWLMLGETVGWMFVLGGATVLAGVILAETRGRNSHSKKIA